LTRAARKIDSLAPIGELFGAAGLNTEVISVAGEDISAAAGQAVAGDHEMIVAAGGGGTVNTSRAKVAGTEKILGVLPLWPGSS